MGVSVCIGGETWGAGLSCVGSCYGHEHPGRYVLHPQRLICEFVLMFLSSSEVFGSVGTRPMCSVSVLFAIVRLEFGQGELCVGVALVDVGVNLLV